MFSFLKLVAFAIAAQLAVAAAFVSNGSQSTAYRPVQQQQVHHAISSSFPTTTCLRMAVDAPEKTKDKKVTEENDTQNEEEKDRGWLIRLYNDPYNKREFVARCLTEICSLDDGRAFQVMMEAHQQGIGVVGNYHREMAEMYRDGLSSEGLMIDMVPADDE